MPVSVLENPNERGLVFTMHGLGAGQDDIHMDFFRKVLQENGFTVVSFNTEHTFPGAARGILKATATNYYEDLQDVISWASGQDWYEEPFWLLGHSLGALCVSVFAARFPDKVKALIAASVLVSAELFKKDLTQKDIDAWAKAGILIGPSTSDISGPINRDMASDIEGYDLIKEAPHLDMPVMLIVGENDDITKLKHHKILFEELPGKKELRIIKGAEHVFNSKEEFSQIRFFMEKFLQENK